MLKKVVSMFLFLILVSCGKEASQKEASNEIFIPVISKGYQHQFWVAVKDGAEKAAKDYGISIVYEGPESETMVDKQIEMLESAIARSPKAIAFAAVDSKAAIPVLKKAESMGIPIVGFDSGVESDIPISTVATDNYAAAAYAADRVAELIGGSGEIAVIGTDQVNTAGVHRRDGFVDRIKSNYKEIKIVDIQYGAGDHAKSADIAKVFFQVFPNLDAIFAVNEGASVGALLAVKETEKKGVVIVGYDSGKLLTDGIRDGYITGAITQDPVSIGYKAVETAYKAYKGEEVPAFVDTGFYYYDKSNIDDPEIQAALYE